MKAFPLILLPFWRYAHQFYITAPPSLTIWSVVASDYFVQLAPCRDLGRIRWSFELDKIVDKKMPGI